MYLKAQQDFSTKRNTQKNLLAISDFQQKNMENFPEINPEHQLNFIPVRAEENVNINIDSVYIIQQNLDNIELSVVLKADKNNNQTFPVSLLNSTSDKLIAKSSVAFNDTQKAEVQFSLPSQNLINGKITLEDDNLYYDNSFFFTIEKPNKIVVTAISASTENYIQRIFKNQQKFDLQVFTENELDYNRIENSDYIVLNELENIPNGLENILIKTQQNGSVITLIPAKNAALSSYNALLNSLQFGTISSGEITQDLKVTNINFSHPLYKNVFNKEVNNFEYPSVKNSFQLTSTGNKVLRYNNGQAFLAEKNQVYVFSAALVSENSNFKNSPLIAPTFYNMAQQSLQLPKLYFSMGKENNFAIPVKLGDDEVLHIVNKTEDFIPRQQKFNNKVQVTTTELPEKAGHFTVVNKKDSLQHLSFNYNRTESDLQFADVSRFNNVKINNSIASYFSESRSANEIDQLWKWFVIFAILFLAIEVLLLKFLN